MINFECQVCSFETKLHLNENNQVDYGDWGMRVINFPEGPLNILVCPECCNLDINQVFEGYKKRIREGKALNYH